MGPPLEVRTFVSVASRSQFPYRLLLRSEPTDPEQPRSVRRVQGHPRTQSTRPPRSTKGGVPRGLRIPATCELIVKGQRRSTGHLVARDRGAWEIRPNRESRPYRAAEGLGPHRSGGAVVGNCLDGAHNFHNVRYPNGEPLFDGLSPLETTGPTASRQLASERTESFLGQHSAGDARVSTLIMRPGGLDQNRWHRNRWQSV